MEKPNKWHYKNKSKDVTWKLFAFYMFIILFVLLSNTAFSQIQVSQFNAEWNSANAVGWVQDLKECKTISYIDIAKEADLAKEHKIAVIPTIITYNNFGTKRSYCSHKYRFISYRNKMGIIC